MATRSTVPASIYTHCWREVQIEKILTQKQTTKTLARARTRTSRSRIPLADHWSTSSNNQRGKQRQTTANNLLGNFPYSKFNISHLTTGAMPSNGCKGYKEQRTHLSLFLFSLPCFEFFLHFFYQTKCCVQIGRRWLRCAMRSAVRASVISV